MFLSFVLKSQFKCVYEYRDIGYVEGIWVVEFIVVYVQKICYCVVDEVVYDVV